MSSISQICTEYDGSPERWQSISFTVDKYRKNMRSCLSWVSKVCRGVKVTKGEEVRRSLERTP